MPITYNSVLMTQDFGARNANRISHRRRVQRHRRRRCSIRIGEARAGVNVTAGAAKATTTARAGGYELDVSNGALNVTFSGGGLANAITVAIIAGADNVKLDVVNGNSIFSSASISLISGVTRANLLGIANTDRERNDRERCLTGNRGSNVLNGKAGADTMRGLTGNDAYYVDNVGRPDRRRGCHSWHRQHQRVGQLCAQCGRVGRDVATAAPPRRRRLNLTGNEFANIVIGNAGNNVLNGGAGTDALQGGAGNDSYVVDNAGDTMSRNDRGRQCRHVRELRAGGQRVRRDAADGGTHGHDGDQPDRQ